jgi:hypothetical protein
MKFLSKNREALAFATKRQLPWYVPTCYGGVGLQPLPEISSNFDATTADKLCVTAMLHSETWTLLKAPMPRKPAPAQDTQVHLVALQELRRHVGQVPTKWVRNSDYAQDGLSSPSLNWWVLYQRPELVLARDIDVSMKVIHHNQRTWSWYFKHLKDFAWMTPSSMEPRRLVHDVTIIERKPAVLPTQEEVYAADLRNFIIREVDGDEALFGSSLVSETLEGHARRDKIHRAFRTSRDVFQ